jgi:Na+/H+ antiporter NhaD/arsenite permease-like protein
MYFAVIAIFLLGYTAIVFEHQINVNKTATALMTGVLCWAVFITNTPDASFFQHAKFLNFQQLHPQLSGMELYADFVGHELGHHLAEIAQILFFLMGAMTIVELVDAHQGFRIVTDRITTKDSRKLLWVLSLITFVLSALLDNLTTAIVMVSLLRKLVKDDTQRKFFVGMVVIAANAGGAWSPIGDVTTTMLWIGGQITTVNTITSLILPSLVCVLVPLLIASVSMKGSVASDNSVKEEEMSINGRITMFWVGVGGLIFVPIFKTVTHLPPYMGILLVLGIVWLASEIIHKDRDEEEKRPFTASHALSKIDSSSILFFIGILLAIAALQSMHILQGLAVAMDNAIGNQSLIVLLIGLASAIIDNVPLVAAAMGMYDLNTYPADSALWQFMAYCAGTGGSILIIGSAAGVAVMGMEKIDFIWYLKKISLWAFLGYLAGAGVYLVMN